MIVLRDVLPCGSNNDIPGGLLRDPEFLRNSRKVPALRVLHLLSYLSHRIVCNLAFVVGAASSHGREIPGPLCIASLAVPVVVVVRRSADKQVRRVAARGVIARVANQIALRYFSGGKSVGDTVSKFFLPVGPQSLVFPVPCAASGPTRVRSATLVNQRPEPIGNWPKLPAHRVPKNKSDRHSGYVPNCTVGSAGDLGFTSASTMAKPISMRPFEIVHGFMVCANSLNVNSGGVVSAC